MLSWPEIEPKKKAEDSVKAKQIASLRLNRFRVVYLFSLPP